LKAISKKERERISGLSDQLYEASRSIRILRHIAWPEKVKEQFFAKNATTLPSVDYPKFDASAILTLVASVKKKLQPEYSPIDGWLDRQATVIEKSACMLSATGTSRFFELSSELYGTPHTPLRDQLSTSYILATSFNDITKASANLDLGAPPEACHLAHSVAEEMEHAVGKMFGDDAPKIQVVDELSANALAGSKRIRIRRTACFTDKDIAQLIHHEAHIHVSTSLNGQAQDQLKLLRAGHPGTTKTQEGLAVFAEFISGSMDLDRMQRLADRVLAVQLAIEGADFIDIYRYYLERTGDESQSFENARRVCRGGVLTGGAPFTKDIVYLDGLIRIHNFLRSIVSTGRADCLRLLFCGKLDIEDIPVLYELSQNGLCRPPKFLPPWASDLRFLLCYLTYSSFLNSMDLSEIKNHYEQLLENVPKP